MTASRQALLEQLYESHRAANPGAHVVSCGLIDEQTYAAAPERVVWVLKEPVDEKQNSGWTLPRYFRQVADGKRTPSRTARRMGALTWGIVNGAASYPSAPEDVSAGLRLLGMTNLKKSGGSSASNWKVIDAEAERTKELWLEELRVMDPTIVICGGTFWNVARHLQVNSTKAPATGARFAVWGSMLVVQAYHPAYWAKGREHAYMRLQATIAAGRDARNAVTSTPSSS